MSRSNVIRLELIALSVLGLLLLVRVLAPTPRSAEDGIVLDDLRKAQLSHLTFVVSEPSLLLLKATGSREAETATNSDLAAHAWVVNRDNHQVLWRMTEQNVVADHGTLVSAEDEIIALPGKYDLFFASYGSTWGSLKKRGKFFGLRLGSHWTGDADGWKVQVTAVDPSTKEPIMLRTLSSDRASETGREVWATGPLSGNRKVEEVFTITRPVTLNVYSVGEFCDEGDCDYGWVENLATGERLWQLSTDNTVHAGGSRSNRSFDGPVHFAPGTYKAVFVTDPGHAYQEWYSNPPFNPYAWGMRITANSEDDLAAVQRVDLWSLPPVAALTRVGNGTVVRKSFTVREPSLVAVAASGEVGRSSLYDFATLKNTSTGATTWQMSWEASVPAGGYEENRYEEAFLTLPPADYQLVYETDDSHAYGSYHNGTPDHPERWGVALFVPEAESRPNVVLSAAPRAVPQAPPVPVVPLVEGVSGEPMVVQTKLGNSAHVAETLALEESRWLRIVALGEVSVSGQYDYGWIEEQETGRRVWEMTRDNTRPAGGDDRNRVHESLIRVPAGTYVVHFRTDFSHAFGDFDDDHPLDGEAWGIRVERMSSDFQPGSLDQE